MEAAENDGRRSAIDERFNEDVCLHMTIHNVGLSYE
jgi:hypothetical protein